MAPPSVLLDNTLNPSSHLGMVFRVRQRLTTTVASQLYASEQFQSLRVVHCLEKFLVRTPTDKWLNVAASAYVQGPRYDTRTLDTGDHDKVAPFLSLQVGHLRTEKRYRKHYDKTSLWAYLWECSHDLVGSSRANNYEDICCQQSTDIINGPLKLHTNSRVMARENPISLLTCYMIISSPRLLWRRLRTSKMQWYVPNS